MEKDKSQSKRRNVTALMAFAGAGLAAVVAFTADLSSLVDKVLSNEPAASIKAEELEWNTEIKALDVFLKNDGKTTALLNKLRITLIERYDLSECGEYQDSSTPSYWTQIDPKKDVYKFDAGALGDESPLLIDLKRVVEPNRADRFAIGYTRGLPAKNPNDFLGFDIVQVDILYNDGHTFNLGKFAYHRFHEATPYKWSTDLECYAEIREAIRRHNPIATKSFLWLTDEVWPPE